MSTWVIVDCEGGPAAGSMTEFGAVVFDTPPFNRAFHGEVEHIKVSLATVMIRFENWLKEQGKPHYVFWSDNPAYDWQHINYAFHTTLGRNPFGHSARRISDFYAGLKRNASDTQSWKRWRKTPHDHNPVNDARGNAEGLWRIMILSLGGSTG